MALATIPTMIVVLIGILLNNARLGDVKEALRAEIRVVEAQIKSVESEVKSIDAQVKAHGRTLETLIDKNHSEMLHRFGDLDTRLTRIEGVLGISRG
ncbi:MAG: hypothetical protein ABL967_04970 [Bryobacteraceae bacterium]